MTSRTAKAATLSVAAVTIVLALLAYSAVLAPATAQTSTASTSAASTTTTNTQSTTTGSYGQCPPGGWGGPFGGPQQGGRGFGGPGAGQSPGFGQSAVSVSVGQTITLTSTKGVYHVVGQPSENGTASGTLTFTVTGSLTEGYTLSLTSGSIVVNGATYTIASGSAQMNPSANTISGQGTTSSSGAFLVQATAHGNFVSSSETVSLDFKAGTTEYLINLTTSIQG